MDNERKQNLTDDSHHLKVDALANQLQDSQTTMKCMETKLEVQTALAN